MMETTQRERLSIKAVNIGLFANILLSIFKTSLGIIGHSSALLADGINSISDVAYYIIVRIFVKLAGKPPDEEHPYGHQQLESIAALVVGAFVITTAVSIFWDSINKVYDILSTGTDYSSVSFFTLVVALFTVVAKVVLTWITRKIGQQTKNQAIIALAHDHRNDVIAASAASIGITLNLLGFIWVDPLAGAVVAIAILKTGIEILRESSDDLMDTMPNKELQIEIHELAIAVPGVFQIEEIKAHRFGIYLVVNITIGIDGSLTVFEGDIIATQVENTLCENISFLQRVHIHYHPAQSLNEPS